jgi:hypothetical protein
VLKFQRCETTKKRIQNRKNAVFGFITDLKPVATSAAPGKNPNSKKNMLSNHPIGCHRSPHVDPR